MDDRRADNMHDTMCALKICLMVIAFWITLAAINRLASGQELGFAPPISLDTIPESQRVIVPETKPVPMSQPTFEVVPQFQPYVPPVTNQPARTVRPVIVRQPNTAYGGAQWTMGSIRMTRANLIAHLMGEIGDRGHRGMFTRAQLNGLSTQQLMNLHSNAHRGRPYTTRSQPTVRTLQFGQWNRQPRRAAVCPT